MPQVKSIGIADDAALDDEQLVELAVQLEQPKQR